MPDALSLRDGPRCDRDAARHGERHADLHAELQTELQAVDLAGTVVVTLGGRAATPSGDHRALAHLVARLAGVDAASVTLTQLCPTCGRSSHGPLTVQLGDATGTTADSATVHASLARSGDRVALAVTAAGPVGIDLESVAEVTRAPLADALLSPAEADAIARLGPHQTDSALTALWTAKEAVLKAAGVGLRVDPRELTIARDRSAGSAGQTPDDADDADNADNADNAHNRRLAEWPHAPFPLADLHLLSVPTPPGTSGTVAVVSARRPALRILPPDSAPPHTR